jgi:hypothetical protein
LKTTSNPNKVTLNFQNGNGEPGIVLVVFWHWFHSLSVKLCLCTVVIYFLKGMHEDTYTYIDCLELLKQKNWPMEIPYDKIIVA